MDTNKVAEDLIKQLLEHGITPEQVTTVLATAVMKIIPITHPAGFDLTGKLFNMTVTGVLADHQSDEVH